MIMSANKLLLTGNKIVHVCLNCTLAEHKVLLNVYILVTITK